MSSEIRQNEWKETGDGVNKVSGRISFGTEGEFNNVNQIRNLTLTSTSCLF